MNNSTQTFMIKQIRILASINDKDRITQCIDQQLNKNSNSCGIEDKDQTRVLNILSRALVVRQIMDKGASLTEAIRELGRRMRALG
jgi:ADP-dependent phosphofructokinase/glucokinase